jgi:hypothetical protein
MNVFEDQTQLSIIPTFQHSKQRNPDKPSRCLTHRHLVSPPVVLGAQLASLDVRERIRRLVFSEPGPLARLIGIIFIIA